VTGLERLSFVVEVEPGVTDHLIRDGLLRALEAVPGVRAAFLVGERDLPAPAPSTRLCEAGLHADLEQVRLQIDDGACQFMSTRDRAVQCPGSHPGLRCNVCGKTWDLLDGDDPRRT
jgi:hypothetical protein